MIPTWIIWVFVIMIFSTTTITAVVVWYKKFNRFIWVVDDQKTQKVSVYKAKILFEDGVEKWQFFGNGWIKIQPAKSRNLLRSYKGSETRIMQRLATDTYIDLDIKELDAAVLSQVPDEGLKDWQHQERKRNFERLMARKDALFWGAIILFIIVIICVTIIFCVYPKYVSKMVDSMAAQAKAYYDIAKCYQENPGMVNSSLSQISNKYIP